MTSHKSLDKETDTTGTQPDHEAVRTFAYTFGFRNGGSVLRLRRGGTSSRRPPISRSSSWPPPRCPWSPTRSPPHNRLPSARTHQLLSPQPPSPLALSLSLSLSLSCSHSLTHTFLICESEYGPSPPSPPAASLFGPRPFQPAVVSFSLLRVPSGTTLRFGPNDMGERGVPRRRVRGREQAKHRQGSD